jgi:uncharacterized protein YbjT (DUF2867 family)
VSNLFPLALSRQPNHNVHVLTRDPHSTNAKYLQSFPNVVLHIGASESESDLRAAFTNITHAYINLNSFALGIKNETYWGIQIFQIARQSGVKHFIWSSLDNILADSGYDESFRVVHYEGKTRVTEWLKAQPQSPMKWSVVTTGPYIESLGGVMRPVQDSEGVYIFRAPLSNGTIPFIYLGDLAKYVDWIFSNPAESAGRDLAVATEDVSFYTVAETFTAVTGMPARYEPISIEEWWKTGPMAPNAEVKLGPQKEWSTDETLMTFRESFTGWWKAYQRPGLIQRDFQSLDRILPARVRSLKDWMELTAYKGELKEVLKQSTSIYDE